MKQTWFGLVTVAAMAVAVIGATSLTANAHWYGYGPVARPYGYSYANTTVVTPGGVYSNSFYNGGGYGYGVRNYGYNYTPNIGFPTYGAPAYPYYRPYPSVSVNYGYGYGYGPVRNFNYGYRPVHPLYYPR